MMLLNPIIAHAVPFANVCTRVLSRAERDEPRPSIDEEDESEEEEEEEEWGEGIQFHIAEKASV